MKHPDLFERPPYLESKLGRSWFDAIPQEPGVYRFYDAEGELIYVGKAKNLRRRLFSYKRARPGDTSSKVSKLLSQIHSLKYETVDTEEEAFLLENAWIREARPEYNHANKHTETYYYVAILQLRDSLRFSLTMRPAVFHTYALPRNHLFPVANMAREEIHQARLYGCFKGHRPVRTALGTLLQLLWMAIHSVSSPCRLPVQLSRNLTPLHYRLPVSDQGSWSMETLTALLDDWFTGRSPELLWQISGSEMPSDREFARLFRVQSVEYLQSYYSRVLARQQRMRVRFKSDREHPIIAQNELDDWLVREGS